MRTAEAFATNCALALRLDPRPIASTRAIAASSRADIASNRAIPL